MIKNLQLNYNTMFNNLPKVGFDPELIFVECGNCGNPILWEDGKSTQVLLGAGVDPLEIDAHCILITNACPRCSKGKYFSVQIARVQEKKGHFSGMKSSRA